MGFSLYGQRRVLFRSPFLFDFWVYAFQLEFKRRGSIPHFHDSPFFPWQKNRGIWIWTFSRPLRRPLSPLFGFSLGRGARGLHGEFDFWGSGALDGGTHFLPR